MPHLPASFQRSLLLLLNLSVKSLSLPFLSLTSIIINQI
nr:MAG TPA: hypothetical protein [Caudoviricetes sp.]